MVHLNMDISKLHWFGNKKKDGAINQQVAPPTWKNIPMTLKKQITIKHKVNYAQREYTTINQ